MSNRVSGRGSTKIERLDRACGGKSTVLGSLGEQKAEVDRRIEVARSGRRQSGESEQGSVKGIGRSVRRARLVHHM